MKQNPGYRLRVIQKRLDDMFQLLNIWQQYIDIIYAPESEIEMLKNMKDAGQLGADGSTLDDVSFANKMENEHIEERLAILFAKDEEELVDEKQKIDDNLQDPYLSVNEGITTDTSMTTDFEGSLQAKRGAIDDES